MMPLNNLQAHPPVGAMSPDNVNAGKSTATASPAEASSRQLEGQLNEDYAIGQTELITDALTECSEILSRELDRLNNDLLDTLSPRERNGAERLLFSAENLLKDGGSAPLSTLAGTDEHQLASEMRLQLQRHPSTEFMERGRTLLDCIGSVLVNDFNLLSGNAPRRMGNVIAVATRTGTIVLLTTMLRQMVGFALEQNFHSLGKNAALTPRMVAGIASLLIGPGLNLAGAVRDERNGTATPTSRVSRMGMGLLSLGGLLIAAAYDPVAVIGHKLAAIGPQMATYSLARDMLQTFFPLHENGGTNVTGTLCSGFMYGIAQVLLSEGMMNFTPQSGAEYLVSEAGRLAEPMADWAAASVVMSMIEPNPLHDLLRSAMNTAAEMFDELQRPALMRYFSAQREVSVAQPKTDVVLELEPLTSGMSPPHSLALSSVTTPQAALDKLNGWRTTNAPPQTGKKRPRSSERPDPATEGVRIGLGRPRIGAGSWPTSAQFADNMLTTCAMRTSVFEAVVAIALTVSTALQKTRLGPADQGHILSALIGGLVMVGYPAFVGAHVTALSRADASTRNDVADGAPAPADVESRNK